MELFDHFISQDGVTIFLSGDHSKYKITDSTSQVKDSTGDKCVNFTSQFSGGGFRSVLGALSGKRRDKKGPGSATITNAALPRHQEEDKTDKTKQAQIEHTYEKH